MILAWRPVKHGNPQGFVVEIDDGCGGDFTEVYSGKKTSCTVSGLQFDSTYRARIRAYSSAGESQSSDVVYLGTPDGKNLPGRGEGVEHPVTCVCDFSIKSISSIFYPEIRQKGNPGRNSLTIP
jgi:tripartite motif-containing protein 9/67